MIMSDDAPTLLLAALRDEMDPVTAALGLSKYGSPRKGQVGGRQLIAMVTGPASQQPDRLVAARALARMGDLESLAALAADKSLLVRAAAIAAWAGIMPGDAASHAARVLAQMESPQDAAPVFAAFVSPLRRPSSGCVAGEPVRS